MGLIQKRAGQVREAEASFQAALAINQALGDSRGQAANLVNLGLIAEEAGRLEEARTRYEAALALDKAVESRDSIAADLANLARIAEAQNHKDVALAYAKRAYWSYRALGETARALAELNHALALSRAQGRQVDAKQLQNELDTLQDSGPSSLAAPP